MCREPGFDEPSDSNDGQDSKKLPASTIGQIGNEPFEITSIFEKGPGSRLNGHNAVKRPTQKQCAKYRVHDQ